MKYNIPVILLKNLIILPNQEIKIELNNELSKLIIKEASAHYDGKIMVVAPIDDKEEEPSVDDLPRVGVVANIKNKIALSDDTIRITLRGIKRVAIMHYYNDKETKLLYSEAMQIDLPKYAKAEEEAVRRKLLDVLKKYIDSANSISNSILTTIKETNDLDRITDIITSFLPFNVTKKLEYMQNINPLNRALKLIQDIETEIKYVDIDNELDDKVRDEFDRNNKDFILKEKLKAIKKELGETSLQEEETAKFRSLLEHLRIDKSIKEKLNHEIDKYEVMNESSPELGVLRNYLDWILNLPWNKTTKEESNFNLVEAKLDESHYGLKKVKERICEYIAIKNFNPDIKSPIICLVGPPGVGKTTIAMSIAKALKRKFYKISVGGLNDSTELIGSRRTYLAANPGKIIQGIKKCGSKNPLILIDEVDKMIRDYKGDPASTLLEILDPNQNKMFTDNFLEEPFDLSEVLFILTANSTSDIPATLLDRVELIELNSYTLFEKKDIAKKYLLPRIYEEHNMVDNNLKFTDELLYFIINAYTDEAGVRELDRILTSLIRKLVINNIKTITKEKAIKLLGTAKYSLLEEATIDTYGIANALAVRNSCGIVTKAEVVKFKGDGKLTITGSVGKVMEESIQVVISYIKSEYSHTLTNLDFHFHFQDATSKKDGPSAGISIAVALLSIIEKKIIPSNIAFTGEMTLNGNILKIGGLKEKLIGAYNKGIKKVYIPKSNEEDLNEVPNIVKEEIEIFLVSNFKEVYTSLFK